ALEIVARTLGQITPRERPQPDRLPLDAPRFLVPQGSPEAKIELGRPGDPAGVMIAIPGADEWNTGAMAHMTIIARALQGTLNQRCTVDRSLAQRVFVQHAPGAGVPGSGLLAVWGICEPGLASLLADEINANLDRMIAEGPNAVELEAARAAALDELDQFFADTRYWARVLSDRTFRVRPLDEPRRLRELIEATPARIAGATLAGLAAQAPRIRIISTPPAPR
ncbi:MAG TPA: hypothetical protein DEB06_11775, partial [Phycisphaerales bacterium]|nr:hypothetical protein [Phycisphaerales bacterium]